MKIGKYRITFQSPIVVEGGQSSLLQFGIFAFLPVKWGTRHLLKKEKRLMAVKFYKFKSGNGLKEAKDKVDEIELKYYPEIVKERKDRIEKMFRDVQERDGVKDEWGKTLYH